MLYYLVKDSEGEREREIEEIIAFFHTFRETRGIESNWKLNISTISSSTCAEIVCLDESCSDSVFSEKRKTAWKDASNTHKRIYIRKRICVLRTPRLINWLFLNDPTGVIRRCAVVFVSFYFSVKFGLIIFWSHFNESTEQFLRWFRNNSLFFLFSLYFPSISLASSQFCSEWKG